jgi:hypothetical protein
VLVLLPTLIALFAAAGGFVIAIRARNSATALVRVTVVPEGAAESVRMIVRDVRLRMLFAVIVAILVAIGLARLQLGDVAVGLALVPGISGASGFLVLAVAPIPRRVPEGGLRQADLTPRTLGTFGPRFGFVLPIAAAAVLVALLVVTGASGSLIEGPFSHEFSVAVPPGGFNSAGPYPDWSYGVFILSATMILIAALLFALHRVAASPRIGYGEPLAIDSALRATLTRFIMLGGTAVVVLYLGVVSLMAGSAVRSASQWSSLKPGVVERLCGHRTTCSFVAPRSDSIFGVVQPTYTLGAIGSVLGIVLIGVAIVLALLALTNFAIRWSVAAPAEAEKVDA